jgi:hypothetical protein
MAGHRQREAAAERVRREGARGAKVRGGGDWWAWCGEAEMGAAFIGVGSWWWGGETVGQAVVVCYQEEAGYGRGGDVGPAGPQGHVGPGEEGGCSGLRWAKRLGGLGAMVGFVMENQKK